MNTLIAIPCMDSMPTDFVQSLLSLKPVGGMQYTFARGTLVYEARNTLAQIAVNGNFDRILWLDSDMVFTGDLLQRFSKHLDEGKEFVCGLFTTRKPPIEITLYKSLRVNMVGKLAEPVYEKVTDIPDEPFEVAGCGFAGCLMTVDLLKRVIAEFGNPFNPAAGFGEDLTFCLRASQVGAKLYCDPTIKMGHVGVTVYYPEVITHE